jgi:hypothetical protein
MYSVWLGILGLKYCRCLEIDYIFAVGEGGWSGHVQYSTLPTLPILPSDIVYIANFDQIPQYNKTCFIS